MNGLHVCTPQLHCKFLQEGNESYLSWYHLHLFQCLKPSRYPKFGWLVSY